MEKKCKYCQTPMEGNAKKKFCSDRCRIAFKRMEQDMPPEEKRPDKPGPVEPEKKQFPSMKSIPDGLLILSDAFQQACKVKNKDLVIARLKREIDKIIAGF